MSIFLTLAFLFFIGSVTGWGMELLFRRFIADSNPERKWINPGFCMGPYLPLYGCGLCSLYLIASLEKYALFQNAVWNRMMLFLGMALCMTIIEYIAGVITLKIAMVRLWDYSSEWMNVQGIICPKFSLIWAMLGAMYYFLIHPYILDALSWLSQNLAFSFFIGVFYGVFTVDFIYSSKILVKLKKFAEDNGVIIRYEHLKSHIRSVHDRTKQKYRFLLPMQFDRPLSEYLRDRRSSFEQRIKKHKK